MKEKVRKRITSKSSIKQDRNNPHSHGEDYKIPYQFKKQLIGLLLILVGLLTLFSIVSYSDTDQTIVKNIKWVQLFRSDVYKQDVQNWLGIAGAVLSDFLIKGAFGYFSLIISVILVVIGYTLLRNNSFYKPINFSLYALLLMLLGASYTGLLSLFFGRNIISPNLSGTVGDFMANLLYHLIGGVGSSVVLIISIIVCLIFLFDSNIVKTLHRITTLWGKLKERLHREKEVIEQKETEKVEKSSELRELLEKERQKIKEIKYSDEQKLKELIKETEINRPVAPSEIKQEDEKVSATLKKPVTVGTSPKSKPTEIEINPENDNEISGLGSKEEDDFIEEQLTNYKLPTLDLLDDPTKEESEVIPDEELNHNGRLLQEKLLKFGIEIEKVVATPGPVVTLYELIPAPDVKLSKIESLQDDIALAMKAKGIRMIIPIPGKGTVGVEIPNSKAQIVRIKEILSSSKFKESKKRLTVAFGKTIDGDIYIDDLSRMPHILIAGATGSGKSVGINTIIASLLYKMQPGDLKFVLIDPKKIELSLYSKLRRHFIATSTDINESIVTSSSNAVSILRSVELEMEQRYDKLANAGVRNIEAYNQKYSEGKLKDNDIIRHRKMPYIVVIIDELADLMITAKRDIEEPIARIAQMARAVGIHLIVATQRPSVDVITGVIKANFPVRIAYQVASKVDSRTILDMGGADQLLRNGDMLYLSSASIKPVRIQNAYISTEECERIVDYISSQQGFSKPYLLPSIVEKKYSKGEPSGERDELFEEAVRLVLKLQQCSTSTLQRRLKLGFARAARIVDQMEAAGIVGPKEGAKGREILISEDEIDKYL
ncbi:MAG: DNA translocase FtsK 4TM domain-containing protein [Ignavibacteria bacterium]